MLGDREGSIFSSKRAACAELSDLRVGRKTNLAKLRSEPGPSVKEKAIKEAAQRAQLESSGLHLQRWGINQNANPPADSRTEGQPAFDWNKWDLLSLPAHQLMGICEWYYQSSVDRLQAERVVLEEQASQFKLGQKPEQEISSELMELSCKHKLLTADADRFQLDLTELPETRRLCITHAISALGYADNHQQILTNDLSKLRDQLRRSPHLASGLQTKIKKLQNQAEETQHLIRNLQNCQWLKIDLELEWINNATRWELNQLLSFHRALRTVAGLALREFGYTPRGRELGHGI